MAQVDDFGDFGDFTIRRAEARIGTVLRDKWRLERLLGVGGMAAVYAAVHRNGKRGAVKMLHVELSTSDEARQRFLKEGYVANAVQHPGAVSVLDDDVAEDGAVFLVMELLDGETAADRAAALPGERLDPGEVLAIADEILAVLGAAHEKGIVHRDLKPENIFLTRDGHAKVLDFGLARLQEAMTSSPRATKTGTAMGTPAFLPPEQALGDWHRVDARTDLWALGATMFTLLTGRLVHVAEGVNKLMLAAMTKPAPRLAEVMPGAPADLCAVVDRALRFEQNERFPSAAEMLRAVRRARASIPGEIARDPSGGAAAMSTAALRRSGEIAASKSLLPAPERSPLRTAFVACGIVILAAGIGAAALLLRGGPPAPAALATAPSPPPAATSAPEPSPTVVPADSSAAPEAPPSDSAAPPASATASSRAAPRASARPRATTAAPAKDPFKTW